MAKRGCSASMPQVAIHLTVFPVHCISKEHGFRVQILSSSFCVIWFLHLSNRIHQFIFPSLFPPWTPCSFISSPTSSKTNLEINKRSTHPKIRLTAACMRECGPANEPSLLPAAPDIHQSKFGKSSRLLQLKELAANRAVSNSSLPSPVHLNCPV